eukprot:GHVS01053031.1.p1 GENE.GHVS01053031.1~~GHVS01053031.1.p1  ORF type:complete len:359 (-),score=49.09 GHVS01053031.1:283-1359(-)
MDTAQVPVVSAPPALIQGDGDAISDDGSQGQLTSQTYPATPEKQSTESLEVFPLRPPSPQCTQPPRERWSGRLSFWLAAIGGAVGIGNLWRFPSLCFEYGGGAFFIPYLIALFFVGIPLLTLELAVGQCFQGGHLVAFNRLSRRFRGVGVAAVFVGFMVTCYYTVILSWGLRYCLDSIRGGGMLPWAVTAEDQTMCSYNLTKATCLFVENDGRLNNKTNSLNEDDLWNGGICRWNADNSDGGDGGVGVFCVADMNKKAKSYFDTTVINKSYDTTAYPTNINPFVVLGLVVVWFGVFLALFRGVISTGIVVYITMSLPLVMLFILAIRGVMLEGAIAGLQQYMGRWDFSVLWKRPEVWK